MNQLVNGEITRDGAQQALDRPFITINVKESTDDLRSADRIDPLNINLNELGQAILVQIENEVVDEVESVANDDQGELVGQFSLLEEVLDFLGVVKVAFPANALDFTNLARSGGGLDVLEVDFGVLAKIDDGPEVVVETLECLETLKHLDQLDWAQNIRVLGGDLDDNLQVLADVNSQHFLQTGHRLFSCQPAEIVYKPLKGE
jgi:hypothetical protein